MFEDPAIMIQLLTGVATIAGAGGMVRAQLNGTRETVREIRKDQKETKIEFRDKFDKVFENQSKLSVRVAVVETKICDD